VKACHWFNLPQENGMTAQKKKYTLRSTGFFRRLVSSEFLIQLITDQTSSTKQKMLSKDETRPFN
jgi:hypothetical protein